MTGGTPVVCPHCGQLMRACVLDAHVQSRHGDARLAMHLTLEQQHAIVQTYRRGATMRQTADQHYCSISTVHRVLHLWDVPIGHAPPHPPYVSAESVLEVGRLYGLGYSISQVADMLGIARDGVRRRLARGGKGARSRSQANRLAYARGRRAPTGAVRAP